MPDHSSDPAPAATRAQLRADRETAPSPDEPSELSAEASSTSAADWRHGGPTVERWREWLLAGALFSLGIAILAGTLVAWLWKSPWAPASATALLWVGMLAPVIWALTLSRPVGLLRLHVVDVLYGLVLGGMLRVAQGWIEQLGGGSAPFPSYPLVDGRLPEGWLFTDVVGVVVVAPAIEEFFFRGVILVSVFVMLRARLGRVSAGVVAVLVSTAVFVLVHSLTLGVSVDQLVATGLLGLVCGALVMLTGRIWGAVLVHAAYNATYVALALAGTFLV